MNAVPRHPGPARPRVARIFAVLLCWLTASDPSAAGETVYLDQGKNWTQRERLQYYSQDQGSRLIPARWLLGLNRPDGRPFLADSLSRYGYLPNAGSPLKGLPVGFTVNGDAVGMTCAACHTRDIRVDNVAYRADGGPAFADFQRFAADLDQAVGNVLTDPAAFDAFARKALPPEAVDDNAKKTLRSQLETWRQPYHAIMSKALPADRPWGPGRLDAISMIFNRLAGLDIGLSDDHIIEANIHRADVPVRYPFIWNAPRQDKTQWSGFAENGTELLGLSRNFGEVLGVFAEFYPQKAPARLLGVDYLQRNSANFDGLKKLEQLVLKMQAPKWPWRQGPRAVDSRLAAAGKAIFDSPTKTEAGGCIGCHGERKGITRSFQKTWATPLCYVGTDERQFNLFAWPVDTGVLKGAKLPLLTEPLGGKEEAVKVLGFAGRATLLQLAKTPAVKNLELKIQTDIALAETLIGDKKRKKLNDISARIKSHFEKMANPASSDMFKAVLETDYSQLGKESGAYKCKERFDDPDPGIAYEARVLYGIWATAPYLHNGSVPTLTALLQPVAERPVEFKIGSDFDPVKVGLAERQTQFDYILKTTDCSDNTSGNSRCGHEFGTRLSEQEKKALLEYLKIL